MGPNPLQLFFGFYPGVVVTEISPDYYARQETPSEYRLSGSGFPLIPDDAVGIVAENNETPLMYRSTSAEYLLYDIQSKTGTDIVLRHRTDDVFHQNTYLGAIVSADRDTVFWVNESKPLP